MFGRPRTALLLYAVAMGYLEAAVVKRETRLSKTTPPSSRHLLPRRILVPTEAHGRRDPERGDRPGGGDRHHDLRRCVRKSVSERVASLAALQRLAAEARGAGNVPGAGQTLIGFALVFGVWDVAYYAALEILLGWPASLFDTTTVELFARPHRCLDLPRLIHVKRAAGRPKDLEVIAELEALLEERGDA